MNLSDFDDYVSTLKAVSPIYPKIEFATFNYTELSLGGSCVVFVVAATTLVPFDSNGKIYNRHTVESVRTKNDDSGRSPFDEMDINEIKQSLTKRIHQSADLTKLMGKPASTDDLIGELITNKYEPI